LRGHRGTIVSRGPRDIDHGAPAAGEDGGHIPQVYVDQPDLEHKVADRLHGLVQHLIGEDKGLGQFEIAHVQAEQPIIGDDDLGINLLNERLKALRRDARLARALKPKGFGDNTDGEDAHALGDTRDHRSGACTRAAAKRRGDKDHVRVLKQGLYLRGSGLRGLLAQGHIASGAQPMGNGLTDLQTHRSARTLEFFERRVDGDKVDTHNAGLDHPLDGIGTPAANTDHLDTLKPLRGRNWQVHLGIPHPQNRSAGDRERVALICRCCDANIP